jgi:hypothetical protein
MKKVDYQLWQFYDENTMFEIRSNPSSIEG